MKPFYNHFKTLRSLKAEFLILYYFFPTLSWQIILIPKAPESLRGPSVVLRPQFEKQWVICVPAHAEHFTWV